MRDMIFNRTLRLIGRKAFTRLNEVKVIIFGIGGVGSWTAEALARSGVSHITIVDADRPPRYERHDIQPHSASDRT